MEGGDLAGWHTQRIIVVLEGVLARPVSERKLLRSRLTDPERWEWSTLAIKYLVDKVQRLNQAVEVVTFMGQEVADMAAAYLLDYEIPAADVAAADLDTFCLSLTWRPEISTVVDSDYDRIARYGQRGYLTTFGGSF